MIRSSELQHVVDRAAAGHIDASTAVNLAMRSQNVLAIGTAKHCDGYVPGVPLTTVEWTDSANRNVGWHPVVTTERGGALPVVRAGKVANTAVWAAFGGDVNTIFQHSQLGRPLLPEDKAYDLGSHGWFYDEESGRFILEAHPDLVAAGYHLGADAVIGEIDLVVADESFSMEIRNEPGHFASPYPHETVATIPVRGGDIHLLLGSVSTSGLNYEPIQL
jgi:hypothetical protein